MLACVCCELSVCVGSSSDTGWRHLSLSGITSGGPNKPSSGLEETQEEKNKSSVFPVLSFPGLCLIQIVCKSEWKGEKEFRKPLGAEDFKETIRKHKVSLRPKASFGTKPLWTGMTQCMSGKQSMTLRNTEPAHNKWVKRVLTVGRCALVNCFFWVRSQSSSKGTSVPGFQPLTGQSNSH